MPAGEDTVCAVGWILKLVDHNDGGGMDGDTVESMSMDRGDENFSLEEHAAR